ncbi:anti-sigma B factor antagonist [Saccharothrix coeruleofusca]|uniref:STAS domain-containing protein n=1 Tax=Saccharothrix coeruleofusca TaxID=33919 RepID=UPI001AE139A4|nr:STAS domain-containing protein [Saccharothrix coeruleofusca]MBP2336826.1 anti-sigma B factor antagonist [Saccharothrix coeruleofusca]
MSGLRITTAAEGTTHRVVLTGELDHETAPALERTLARLPQAAGHRLVIDLSGLALCDSSGLTTFIVARERALAAGTGFELTAPPPPVSRMLRVTGLDRVLLARHPQDA